MDLSVKALAAGTYSHRSRPAASVLPLTNETGPTKNSTVPAVKIYQDNIIHAVPELRRWVLLSDLLIFIGPDTCGSFRGLRRLSELGRRWRQAG